MLPLQLRGQLIAVFNEKAAIESVHHGCKVIFIGDPVQMAERQNYYISGAIFLPRVECMQALVNGDNKAFYDMYMRQLYSDSMIHEFLDTIVCALYQGKTVIFYVPEIGYEFNYHEVLFQFIHNMYGLYTQKDANHRFFYEQGFMPTLDALYRFGQIDKYQYLALLPDVKVNDNLFLVNRLYPMFQMENNKESFKYILQLKMRLEKSNCRERPMITFF